jgi:hypothetical protein
MQSTAHIIPPSPTTFYLYHIPCVVSGTLARRVTPAPQYFLIKVECRRPQVTSGMEVVEAMESNPTKAGDVPVKDVVIADCGQIA